MHIASLPNKNGLKWSERSSKLQKRFYKQDSFLNKWLLDHTGLHHIICDQIGKSQSPDVRWCITRTSAWPKRMQRKLTAYRCQLIHYTKVQVCVYTSLNQASMCLHHVHKSCGRLLLQYTKAALHKYHNSNLNMYSVLYNSTSNMAAFVIHTHLGAIFALAQTALMNNSHISPLEILLELMLCKHDHFWHQLGYVLKAITLLTFVLTKGVSLFGLIQWYISVIPTPQAIEPPKYAWKHSRHQPTKS